MNSSGNTICACVVTKRRTYNNIQIHEYKDPIHISGYYVPAHFVHYNICTTAVCELYKRLRMRSARRMCIVCVCLTSVCIRDEYELYYV